MNERRINAFFGDAESGAFGTGWWSGISSAFFGALSFGGVLCLHFPQILSSPELRPHYPMHVLRLLIQGLIIAAPERMPLFRQLRLELRTECTGLQALQALKTSLDPKRVLNPGKLLPEVCR